MKAICKKCVGMGYKSPHPAMPESELCSLHQSSSEIEDEFLAVLEATPDFYAQIKPKLDMETRKEMARVWQEAEKVKPEEVKEAQDQAVSKVVVDGPKLLREMQENTAAQINKSPMVRVFNPTGEPRWIGVGGLSWIFKPGWNEAKKPFADEFEHQMREEARIQKMISDLSVNVDNPSGGDMQDFYAYQAKLDGHIKKGRQL